MRCRSCGHENPGRTRGRCENCGFLLDNQNDPLREQRSALQKPLQDKDSSTPTEAPKLVPTHKKKAGLLGLAIFLVGALGGIYIVSSFERSVYEPEVNPDDLALEEVEIPVDSLPIMLGTDIVYVFNAEGTSASPRTNVDLSLIPEGTKVSFLAHGSISIQPVVNYMGQKINSSDFRYLAADSLFAWLDTTETAYASVPILKPVPPPEVDSTVVQPVELKLLFTDEWFRCQVEEYGTDVVEPVTSMAFNQRIFNRSISQVERSINRRNTEDRPVHITLIVPGTSTLLEAVDIAESVLVYTDTLGYSGFHIKWANVTQ